MRLSIMDKQESYSYVAHNESMRIIEAKLQEERLKHLTDVVESNDRRYEAVSIEKEKALKIKETADEKALALASEAQTYKDARNETMREQTLKDNGVYATRTDLSNAIDEIRVALKPLADYITGQQGGVKGSNITTGKIVGGISLAATIIGVIVLLGQAFIR